MPGHTRLLGAAGALAALIALASPASAAAGLAGSPFELHDAHLLGTATNAGCLADVRDVDTRFRVTKDVRQRVDIDPKDALLAIGWVLTTGHADVFDVLDIERDVRVRKLAQQDADLSARNVASAIALGGGICRGAFLGPLLGAHGGGLALGGSLLGPAGLGLVSPLDIADVTERNRARSSVDQRVSMDRDTVLAAIALGNIGLPGVHDLGLFVNKDLRTDLDLASSHHTRLDNRQALLDLALLA